MFSYTVSKTASEKAFMEVCSSIESRFKEIRKEKILVDVDGTAIQIYHKGKDRIKVYNDYEVDAVYVDSEVELKNVL